MRVIETLDPATEWLYKLALELDNVPVSAQRLLWLQEVIGDTYAQNDDGDWLHYSGRQLRVQHSEWTIGLDQGDVNTLVDLIRLKADPGYFLLDPAALSECEEILDAKTLSFDHTDPANEKARQEIAAGRGVPYVAPVGEGTTKTNMDIQRNLYNVGSLESAVRDRGKGRYAHLPPIRVYDTMLLRPLDDILNDMTHRERGIYKRFCREDRRKGFPGGEEYAKKLAAEAIREARERGTEGLWQGNLRSQLRNRVVRQYETLGQYRDLSRRREITYNRYTGLSERNDRGYLRYPVNGYDLEGSDVSRSVTIHTWPVVLCWAQLRTIARVHLHNQLLDLLDEGELAGIDTTGCAPRSEHPAVQAIAQAHSGSYLDFLEAVRQDGSRGLVRGEPANNANLAKRAAKERMDDIEQNLVLTESIRQTAPKWFVRHLVAVGRLSPSPLRGSSE